MRIYSIERIVGLKIHPINLHQIILKIRQRFIKIVYLRSAETNPILCKLLKTGVI